MINDMGKAARHWPERIKLTLNSIVLLAFCFCTLHTVTLLRVPVLHKILHILYLLTQEPLSNVVQNLFHNFNSFFFFLGFPMLALFNFLIISSNFLFKSSINLELPLCSYNIVSKLRTHSMHLGH